MLLRALRLNSLKKIYQENVQKMLRDPNRKSLLLQVREILWLAMKQKYWPHNYYRYKCYIKGHDVKELIYYLPGRLFDIIRADCVNDSTCKDQCNDKIQFKRLLTSRGLPAAEAFGYFQRGQGFSSLEGRSIDEQVFLKRLDGHFVVKPARDTSCGRGIIFFSTDQKTATITSDKGDIIPIRDFSGFLTKHHNEYLLIERKLRQHAELDAVYSRSVNTVRIDTLRCLDGHIIVLKAFIRFGRRGRTVDNLAGIEGGVAIPVDITTGQLKLPGYDYYLNEYKEHPDTGFVFKDKVVPFWAELKETICRAHQVFDRINSIGWDVAITPEGPALVEGNHDYDMYSIQSMNGGYLKDEVFTREILGYVRRSPFRAKYEKYFMSAV